MQITYLHLELLALGIVNKESEVFLPHRFIGFVPNLKEISKISSGIFAVTKHYHTVFIEYCTWQLRMTPILWAVLSRVNCGRSGACQRMSCQQLPAWVPGPMTMRHLHVWSSLHDLPRPADCCTSGSFLDEWLAVNKREEFLKCFLKVAHITATAMPSLSF